MRLAPRPPKAMVGLAGCLLIGLAARPVLADTVTLQCGAVGQQGSLTLDVDYDRQTVFVANGNPPRTVNATIESRFITFDNPYIPHRHRIDRVSGGFSSFIEGNWYAAGSCEKLASGGKPKF